MAQLADWMLAAIQARSDQQKLASIKQEVVEFAHGYPLPSDKR
jgi:glycine/serine hydroxymethyltransferase